MKNTLIKFFSNKFNLILTIVQSAAVLCFLLNNALTFLLILGIVLEGVFFIVLGVRMFFDNKKIRQKEDLMRSLPMQREDEASMQKNNTRQIKANIWQAVLYIVMGIILIFLVLF